MPKSAHLALTAAFMLISVTAAPAATCEAWHQQCARFHGYQTPDWQACMNQPQAQYDCGAGVGMVAGTAPLFGKTRACVATGVRNAPDTTATERSNGTNVCTSPKR
jgi:hypothetical protein